MPPKRRTGGRTMTAEPLLHDEVTVGEAIVRVLEQAGIDALFGMPGGGMGGSIFNALYDHQTAIRTVLAREEGLATVMAEAYGRLTGRPGVCSGSVRLRGDRAGDGLRGIPRGASCRAGPGDRAGAGRRAAGGGRGADLAPADLPARHLAARHAT